MQDREYYDLQHVTIFRCVKAMLCDVTPALLTDEEMVDTYKRLRTELDTLIERLQDDVDISDLDDL